MPSTLFRKDFFRRIINLPGWHTHRKIVVFDSDDWGSIALPSKKVFESLRHAGFNVENNPYLRYDSLESEDDLSSLFNLLSEYKDFNGRHPVFTANTVVANPDFNKIRASDFQEYHYELFTETLNRYPAHSGSFAIWKKGIEERLFFPQFHAREHLNIAYWMKELQKGHPQIHLGFNNNFYILDTATHPDIKHSCASAFYSKSIEEAKSIESILRDGLNIFKKIFGYASESFTGTGYIWETSLEKIMKEEEVKLIKGLLIQREPILSTGELRNKYHYTGQKNKFDQLYIVRNAFFEPGIKPGFDWISDCMNRMEVNFKSFKPTIISTHRINYIGSIDKEFRNTNLKQFETLLKKMLHTFPEIEFMTSSELGNLILNH